jgi:hypothetical protein
MNRLRSIVGTAMGLSTTAVVAAGSPSCSSSPAQLQPGHICSLNSDCNSPLVCVFALCHQQCNVSSDCPTGQRCVPGAGGEGGSSPVCQLPAESTCSSRSCVADQTCGSDSECRATCGPTMSCGQGMTCSASGCLDPHDPVDELIIVHGGFEAGSLQEAGSSEDSAGGGEASADASLDQSSSGPVDAPPDVSFTPNPASGALGFTPTNLSLSGLDAGPMGDAGIFTGAPDITFTSSESIGNAGSAYVGTITQNDVDQTQADLYVMRSLTVTATGSLSISGDLPQILVVLTTVDIQGPVVVTAGGFASSANPGPGTGQVESNPGGGGGGGYCGAGGDGTSLMPPAPKGGAQYGNSTISPLFGGSVGSVGNAGGFPGGALQIIAGTFITIGSLGSINAGGGGGDWSGGGAYGAGGSGGAILLEAPTVTIRGAIAANGGGGGSPNGGSLFYTSNASASAQPATGQGPFSGQGSAGSTTSGGNGEVGADDAGTTYYGAGGGGAGWIRINTAPGGLTIASGAVVSPSMAPATTCASQGLLAP